MNEPDLPPLDEDVRALLRRAASAAADVPAGVQSHVLARVEAAIGPGGGPPGGAPGASTPPSAGSVSGLSRIWPIAAAFVIGSVTGALVTRFTSPRPAPVERVVYLDRVVPLAPTTPAVATASTTAQSTDVPASTTHHPASSTEQPGQLADERLLLDVARRSLEQQDAVAALDAVARHERRYPNGILAQEREAMAVRALMQLGRTGEARARAERFRVRFPDSMLLPAVEAAVGSE